MGEQAALMGALTGVRGRAIRLRGGVLAAVLGRQLGMAGVGEQSAMVGLLAELWP